MACSRCRDRRCLPSPAGTTYQLRVRRYRLAWGTTSAPLAGCSCRLTARRARRRRRGVSCASLSDRRRSRLKAPPFHQTVDRRDHQQSEDRRAHHAADHRHGDALHQLGAGADGSTGSASRTAMIAVTVIIFGRTRSARTVVDGGARVSRLSARPSAWHDARCCSVGRGRGRSSITTPVSAATTAGAMKPHGGARRSLWSPPPDHQPPRRPRERRRRHHDQRLGRPAEFTSSNMKMMHEGHRHHDLEPGLGAFGVVDSTSSIRRHRMPGGTRSSPARHARVGDVAADIAVAMHSRRRRDRGRASLGAAWRRTLGQPHVGHLAQRHHGAMHAGHQHAAAIACGSVRSRADRGTFTV